MASRATTIVSPPGSEPSLSRAPSIFNSGQIATEKDVRDHKSGDVTPVVVGDTQELDNAEYPTGFRLVAVVLALVLSIFLVALDMVRHYPILSSPLVLRVGLGH